MITAINIPRYRDQWALKLLPSRLYTGESMCEQLDHDFSMIGQRYDNISDIGIIFNKVQSKLHCVG